MILSPDARLQSMVEPKHTHKHQGESIPHL